MNPRQIGITFQGEIKATLGDREVSVVVHTPITSAELAEKIFHLRKAVLESEETGE